MTGIDGVEFLQGGWRMPNGFSWTIFPKGMPVPDGCMRVTTYGVLREVAARIAGDEVATDGNWVSVLIDCHVDFDTTYDIDTTANINRPPTTLNLVLAGSTAVALIATLAVASRKTELLDSLPERWQIPVPGRHSGAWAQGSLVPNGLSGLVPFDELPVPTGERRLIITEPEFGIVGDVRGGMWCSVTALRPWWISESAGPIQLGEVNLVLHDPAPLVATLLHAVGQPGLAGTVGAGKELDEVLAELSEGDVLERVLNAIEDTYEQGLVSERSGAGQEPEQDDAPSPNAHADANGAEHVIGIAELVDAVMELNHDTPNPRRREYLLATIEIIAMELGAVDDRFNLFPALLSPDLFSTHFGSPIPSDFLTLKLPGIEDPPQVAGPYLEVEQRAHSLDAAMRGLRDEILELRREWLTSALLKVEPALEYRTTTEARLRARGLSSRP